MKIQFDDNHYLAQSQNEVRLLCDPMFEKFDLQYFSYGKFYDDGKCTLLCTNKNVFDNHFKKEYKLTIAPNEKESYKKQIYNLIYVDENSPDIITDEYTLFKHGTMMDIIKKNNGYYEMFCYVSKHNAINQANHFLNNLDVLDEFSKDFLLDTKKIMNKANESIIQLPASMMPGINDLRKPDSNKFKINHDRIQFVLPERQYQCLSLLTTGKSSKEIANILNLSYRTVEKHIEILRYKLNCSKKSELISIGLRNSLNKQALSLEEK